jgi:hypothetical protein
MPALVSYNSDFFLKSTWVHASTDQLVEAVNNELQLLWRVGAQTGVDQQLMRTLDNRMKLWVEFKQQYDDAVFRRAADPFDWFGRDYDEELRSTWVPWVRDLIAKFSAASPAAAQRAEDYGLQERSEQYAGRADLEPAQAKSSSGAWGLWLGVAVTVGLIGAGVYMARGRA